MKLLTLHLYPLIAFVSLFGTVAIPAHGQPITPATDGTGTKVNQNGNQFNIQGGTQSSNGANLFHSFTQFNVESNQTANFLTTPDIRNILGRVTGGNASTINGLIQLVGGNSNLFLMNPTGIIFGPNASLNVPAAFSVTTATGIGFNGNNFWFKAMGTNDYSNLVGNPSGYHFDVSNPGAIVNQGNLSLNPGNNLTLVGGTVVNTGELSTTGGNITIAAVNGGDTLRISQSGHVLSLDVSPISGNLSGKITPLSLTQLLTGGETNHASSIVVDAQGNLALTDTTGLAVASGNIDVSTTFTPSLSQGEINILGSQVAVIDGNINANAINGGSRILIGGDVQGNGNVPNSQQTFVNNNSLISADAINNGNGGRIIIWSDDTTNFAGNISAKGGEFSGDGGFVEISGKQHLIFDGNVNVSAALGESGTILFDPKNIIIGAETPNQNEEDNQTFSAEEIEGLEGEIILQADNDITVNQAIETSDSIELNAGRSININADIDTSSGNSNIALFGNYNGANINNRDSGAASINQREGTTLNAGSGNITIKLGNLGANGDINLANLTTTGQLLVNANQGNISRVSPNSLITANRAIFQTQDIGGVGLAEAPLRIDINNLEVLTGDKGVFIESISNLIIGGVSEEFTGIATRAGGNFELNINGNLTVTEEINTSTPDIQPGNITISSSGNIDTTQTTLNANSESTSGGDVVLSADGDIKTGEIDVATQGNNRGGNITINSGGEVDTTAGEIFSASFQGNGGNVTITSNNDLKTGYIDSRSEGSGNGGNITLESTDGNVDTSSDKLASFSIGGNAGNVSITSQGDIKTADIFSSAGKPLDEDGDLANSSPFETNNTNSNQTASGSGGDITLTAEGTIDTSAGTIESFSRLSAGGIVSITSKGDITTGGVFSTAGEPTTGASVTTTGITQGEINSSNSGNITIESTEGTVTTTAEIDTTAVSGNAGSVTIKAFGDIKTENIESSTFGGQGGDITLKSTGGNIDTSSGELRSSSLNGNAGTVSLTSQGDIKTGNVASFAGRDRGEAEDEDSENSVSGNGGNITLKAGGTIDTTAGTGDESELESFSRDGSGGNISLEAKGDITTGAIFSTAGDPENTNTTAITQTEENGASSGDISIKSTEGTVTTTAEINSFATTGDGGSVSIESFGDINIGNSATEEGVGGIDSSSEGNGRGGNITLESTGGNIDSSSVEISSSSFNGNAGNVSLTSQGNITTGNISSFAGRDFGEAEDSENSGSGDGGNITLKAGGTIDTTAGTEEESELESFSRDGSGGNISLEAKGDITTGRTLSTAGNPEDGNILAGITQTEENAASSGDITIKSTEGRVTTTAEINSFATTGDGGSVTVESFGDINIGNEINSRSDINGAGGNIILESQTGAITIEGGLSSFSELGNAGDVNIISSGDLTTSSIDSRSRGNGQGGSITLESTGGNIDTSSGELASSSSNGNSGNISLTSQGDIKTGNVASFAGRDRGEAEDEDSENSVSGDGGDITLKAGGTIDTTAGTGDESDLESFSRDGSGGNISLEAKGDITTGAIFSTAGDPENTNITAITQTEENGASSGNISIKSTEGAVTTTAEINSFATTGDGGDITIKSFGNINIGGNETEDESGNIDSRADTNGNGGKITIESQTGAITINSELSSSSQRGDGGDVEITAPDNIQVGRISSSSDGDGKGGNITIESTGGNVDTTRGELESSSFNGNAGSVSITSQGDIKANSISSFAGEEESELLSENQSGNGNGGDITLNAGGIIEIRKGDFESFSRNGNGGNIEIKAQGNITTGKLLSTAGDPEGPISEIETNSGSSGKITITSEEGSITVQREINSLADFSDGGDVTITSHDDINIEDEINSRSDRNGKGGDIKLESATGGINIGERVSSKAEDGEGGAVKLSSQGDIQTGEIESLSRAGNGGDVEITTPGDIQVGTISSSSEGNGQGGNITIKSTGGSVDTRSGELGSFSRSGDAGAVKIEALEDIKTGQINSLTEVGQGGDITINSTSGSVNTFGTEENTGIFSSSVQGDAGKITITSNGNLTTGDIDSRSERNGEGGNITLNSTSGDVNTSQGVLASYSGRGNAGSIDISSKGDLITGEIFSSSGEPVDSDNDIPSLPGVTEATNDSNSGENGGGRGGDITLDAEGEINAGSIESFSRAGDAGDVTIKALDNIKTGQINSLTEGNGQGGNITIESTNGSVNTVGTEENTGIFSSSVEGDAGNITITSNGNLITGDIDSRSKRNGQGGNIILNSTSGNVDTSGGVLASFSGRGNAGNIEISSNGNLTTGEIFSTSGEPLDSNNDLPSLPGVTEQQIDNSNVGENSGGRGGHITLEAEGKINAGGIESFSRAGDAGDVTIKALDNIKTGQINSLTEGNGQGGDITIESTNGSVNTVGTEENTGIFSSSVEGDAGNITITSNGNLTTGDIDSRSERNGQGGNITLKSTIGDVDTSQGVLASYSGRGNAGSIDISSKGDLITGEIFSSSGEPVDSDNDIPSLPGVTEATNDSNSGENSGGRGGNITLEAEGEINAGGIESFSREGTGGSITIKTKGNIITSEIISSAADPENISFRGENLESQTITQSQIQEPTGNPGGNITIESTEGTVTTQGEITSYSNKGPGGNISIISYDDINIRNNETDNEPGVIDSRTDTTNRSNGGKIFIESKTGNITIEGELSSSSQTGKGGDIKISAPANITSGTIYSYSEVNGDGGEINITSTQGNLEIGEIFSSSGEPLDRSSENQGQTNNSNSGENTTGGGGDITLNANQGTITVGDIESFSRQGVAGNISVSAKDDITTNAIISSAGDPEDIPPPGQNADDATITQSQVEQQNNRPGGNISIISTEGTVTTNAEITSYSDKGNGGNIEIFSKGDINIIPNSDPETNAANIDSRSDGTGGSGGNILIKSQTGIIDAPGKFASSSQTGNGGNVEIIAPGNIQTGTILSFSEGNGNGGDVSITGNSSIQTGTIASFTLGSGNSGNISIFADGAIDTSVGQLLSFSELGEGGNVILSATENIITGFIESFSGGGTRGGNITLETTNGNIDTTVGPLDLAINIVGVPLDIKGFLGAEANIPTDADVSSEAVATTFAEERANLSSSAPQGTGGNIIIIQRGQGDITTSNISSFGGEDSGRVNIINNDGNINTGVIFSTAINGAGGQISAETINNGDLNINHIATYSSGENGTGGDINLDASGIININNIASFGNAGSGDVSIQSSSGSISTGTIQTRAPNGTSGNITLNTFSTEGDIRTASVTTQGGAAAGEVEIIAPDGSVTTEDLESSSESGSAGGIDVQAGEDIETGDQTVDSETGDASISNVAGEDIETGDQTAVTEQGDASVTNVAGEDIATGDQTAVTEQGDASVTNVAGEDITTGDQTAITEQGDATVTNVAGGDVNTGNITAITEQGDATVTNVAGGDVNTGNITAITEQGNATVNNVAGGDVNTGNITAITEQGDATVTNVAGGDVNTGNITAITEQGNATVTNVAGGDVNTGNITAIGDTTNIINQPGGEINTGEIIQINPSPSTPIDNTLPQLLPQTPITQVNSPNQVQPSVTQVNFPNQVQPSVTQVNSPNQVQPSVTQVNSPNQVQPSVTQVNSPNQVQPSVTQVNSPNQVQPSVTQVNSPNQVQPSVTQTPITTNLPPSNNQVLNPVTTQILQSVSSNSTITTTNNPNLPNQQSDRQQVNPNTDTTTTLENINIVNTIPLTVAANSTTLTKVEQNRNNEFSHYLELDLSNQITFTKNIREVLIDIARQTGNNSAIIYVTAYPDTLQLVLYTPGSDPILKSIPGVKRKELMKVVLQFRAQITNPARRNTDSYLPPAQKLYNWLIAPIAAELEAAKIDTLLFSMDEGLRALPVAALHDGKQFLIEKYSLSLIPSVSLMDTNYRSLQDAQVLAMGASDFIEQNALPAVPTELETISQKLWQGSTFINEEFTRNNLLTQRENYPYPIIHLATHAEFKPGKANNSYIQLWGTDQLKLDEIRELGWNKPAVELLVLSACRTAFGDKNAELGFAGLAVAAGVKSALASIWYVSDEGTLGLMTEFYVHLNNAKIKAEALRQAQLAMLRGEVVITEGELRGIGIRGAVVLPPALGKLENQNLSHPYYWSGFMMIGSPW